MTIKDNLDIYNPPPYIALDVSNQLNVHEDIIKLVSFIFRGHTDSTWKLESSLEREYKSKGNPITQDILGVENNSIDFFRKRAHLYNNLGLAKDSKLPDILSGMQHHGCPTRLLDFTKSFFIASYFSVNNIHSEAQEYSIWAINHAILQHKTQELMSQYLEVYNIHELLDFVLDLQEYKPDAVFTVEPENITRRMSCQQGVLLAQTNMHMSFMHNLCALLNILDIKQSSCETASRHISIDLPIPQKIKLEEFKEINEIVINSHVYIIKFTFKSEHKKRVRKDLLTKNITSETLFPDIHGLARSAIEHVLWQ